MEEQGWIPTQRDGKKVKLIELGDWVDIRIKKKRKIKGAFISGLGN